MLGGAAVNLAVTASGSIGQLPQDSLDAAFAVKTSERYHADTSVVGAEVTAPAASASIVQTAALAAGDYDLQMSGWTADTGAVGKRIAFVHRNAADNADIRLIGGCGVPGQVDLVRKRYTLAVNEFVRARAGAAGAASSVYGAFIQAKVSV